MKEYLFSYGTLQYEKTQLEIFGKVLLGTPDILDGYKLFTIEIRDPIFLARGEARSQSTLVRTNYLADHVEGTVFEINREELQLTDKYEPGNYQRIKVALRSGKEAWIYMAT
ncbi:MAG TPA: gamma-glutamylcyclotransferase family protein [Chitinophagaceae bacterium]|nr:gamma-glutamylcyclotransferase family protein [Chitinophagaceae bacterium]